MQHAKALAVASTAAPAATACHGYSLAPPPPRPGMAALPLAFSLLGLGVAVPFLLGVGFLTFFSLEALALGTLATGHFSFPEVVRALCGHTGALVLELCLIIRCFG